MSRYYKAITGHVPIDYAGDLNSICRYFEGKDGKFVALHERWKLRPLEFDDAGALIEQLTRRIVGFALDCNAMPRRTPLQLIATAKNILKNPSSFVQNPGAYDPEVSAMVYAALCRGRDGARERLQLFDCGRGPAPDVAEVSSAVEIVLNDLRFEAAEIPTVGGQTLALQRGLAKDLARIFENYGGRVSRATRFDLASLATSVEYGPFHEFLEIVLPSVQPFARLAGFKMTSIRSLVATVMETPGGARKSSSSE